MSTLKEKKPKAAKAKPKSESAILGELLKWLNEQPGVWAHRNQVGGVKAGARFIRYGLGTGSADVVGSVKLFAGVAVPFAIEAKREDGTLSEAQEKWLRRAHAAGWLVGVCKSVDDARTMLECSGALLRDGGGVFGLDWFLVDGSED